jgi:hypothetical protein
MRRLLFAAILTGCLSGRAIEFAEYDVVLEKGERISSDGAPAALTVRTLPASKSTSRGGIEDDILALDCSIKSAQIVLNLRNRRDRPIRIDWRGGVFVDEEGRRHEGLWMSLAAPAEASSIPPGRSALFIGGPADVVPRRAAAVQVFKNFLTPPPAPPNELPAGDVAAYCAKVGRPIEIVLPVESEGHRYEYRLHFRIAGIVVLEQRGDVPLAKRDWGGCRN